MKFKTEADVARPVVAWLEEQHWDVYQEVQFSKYGGSVADIVAVRHKLLWIIEVKKSLTLSVLEQAYRWPTPLRSIAVPKAQTPRRMANKLAKEYFKVGVIEVGQRVYEAISAPIQRGHYQHSIKYYLPKLKEEHKTFAEAGSTGRGHFTPYKQTIKWVKTFIKQNPSCTINDIYKDLGDCHYAGKASMKSNLQKALDMWEDDWCVVDKTERPWKFSIAKG